MDFFGNLMQQTCGIQKQTHRWVVWWYDLVSLIPNAILICICMHVCVCLFLWPRMFPVFSFEFSSENKKESKKRFFYKSLVFLTARPALRWMVHAATQHNTMQCNATQRNKQNIYMKSQRIMSNVSKYTLFLVDADVMCIYFLIVVIIIIIINRICKLAHRSGTKKTAKIAASARWASKATNQGMSKQCSCGRSVKLLQYTNEWMTQYHCDWLSDMQGNSYTGESALFKFFVSVGDSFIRSFIHAGRHGPTWFIDRPNPANHAT